MVIVILDTGQQKFSKFSKCGDMMSIFDKLFGKKKVVERKDKEEKLEEVGACDDVGECQIELHGDWKSDLMSELTYMGKRKRDPVKVYAEPNMAKKFLAQKVLPYLWPDDEHRNYIDSKDEPQEYLRWLWIMVYLHHPDPKAIIDTLRFSQEIKKKKYLYFVADLLPYLLIFWKGSLHSLPKRLNT